jgi:hypothetical protein
MRMCISNAAQPGCLPSATLLPPRRRLLQPHKRRGAPCSAVAASAADSSLLWLGSLQAGDVTVTCNWTRHTHGLREMYALAFTPVAAVRARSPLAAAAPVAGIVFLDLPALAAARCMSNRVTSGMYCQWACASGMYSHTRHVFPHYQQTHDAHAACSAAADAPLDIAHVATPLSGMSVCCITVHCHTAT